MKLPRITIEYYEEESFAPGKLSFPLIMGFGVHWAWVYLFMFGGSSPFSSQAGGIHSVLFLVSATCLAVTLLCYGVFLSAARRLFSTPEKRNRNRFAAASLVLAGMALMLMANAVPGMALVFSTASGVLTGVGSAVLLMSYGVSFSVCDLATLSVSVAASFLVSVVLFVALVALDSVAPAAGMVVVLALPLVEALCLKVCSTQLVDRLEFNSMTMPVHRGRFALHVVAPCVAFSIILSTLRMRAASLLIGVGIELAPSVFFAGVLVAVLIVLAMYTQRQANNFEFRTLCPVVALLLASLVLPGASEGSWATFALFASYLMLEACMWIMCADISQHFRISAFTVFGFGRGALAAGSVVVYALSSSEGIIGHAMRSTEGLVTLALVAITLGVALLPHASELRLTLRRGRQCPAFATSVDSVVDLREADAMSVAAPLEGDAACPGTYAAVAEGYVAAQMRVAAESGAGALRSFDAGAVSAGVTMEPAVEAAAASTQVVELPPDESTQPEAAQPASGCEGSVDVAEPAAAASAAAPAIAKGAPAAEASESSERAMGSFKLKCSSVAERYLLSRKETEVLFLLAKGHNSAYIQKALYISAGTANTHMRHIYRKLDVHSQQEVIEAVESEPIE